jgi:hypothetical protein
MIMCIIKIIRIRNYAVWSKAHDHCCPSLAIDISQYRRFLGSFSYLRTVFRLNCLTALEGGKYSIYKFDHHNINGGAVDNT